MVKFVICLLCMLYLLPFCALYLLPLSPQARTQISQKPGQFYYTYGLADDATLQAGALHGKGLGLGFEFDIACLSMSMSLMPEQLYPPD